MQEIRFDNFSLGKGQPLVVFAGPCVIESEDLAVRVAEELRTICDACGVSFVYKSSYDKANRSAFSSFRGPGLEEGLRILEKVKKQLQVPVVTDVHSPQEATKAAEVCDVLQIPAFLCRQTDLVCAAAATGRIIKVKKGQFLAPWDMKNVIDKVVGQGNHQIILTERGVSFGYNNLVVDMRSIPIMQDLGYPVCFDATHAVQLPGGNGTASGGERQFIAPLARAAVAAGCNAVFIETHPNPSQALSDRDSVLPLEEMHSLLQQLQRMYQQVV